jgi:hypothetical protein
VTLNGLGASLGSFTAGTITGGALTLAGNAKSISASAIAGTWSADVGGIVTSLTVKGDLAGSFSAASIGKVQVGSMTGATMNLAGTGSALGSLSVTGGLTNSTIRCAGSIGNVTVGGATGSSIFAGISSAVTSALPVVADFINNASLASFTAKGKFVFSDTFIAAQSIGSVALTNVTTGNGGEPFGIATRSLRSFTLAQPKQKLFSWNNKQPLALLNALPGDLRVQML